ncbi:hypothetical protein F8564_10165 [Serratia sp. RJAL6]|nr:hypothetical protein F8564_10165 [Enterobacter sp. RJAL6]
MDKFMEPEQFDAEVEIHDGEPFAVWAPAVNGSHVKAELYFSLLAELEAKDNRIAELEGQLQSGFTPEALAQEERAENAEQRVAELEAKLATPVQLQNCDFESVAIMAHWCTDEQLKAWVKGVEHAKKQIRAAGFTVEGDE